MLDDRNNLTHDYDYLIAKEKFDTIVNSYIQVFGKLHERVLEMMNENN